MAKDEPRDDSGTDGDEHPKAEDAAASPKSATAKKRDDEAEADSKASGPKEPERAKAAWGEPLARFEQRWTAFEARLITVVLVAEILVLVGWVLLSGLASPASANNATGTVFRSVVGALVLGLAARAITKRMGLGESKRGTLTIALAIAAGIVLGPTWRSIGVDYFGNARGWLQEGSTLTLMNGLSQVATRLTLWLALLGASLATGMGKHIHIDVVFRFLPARLRLPVAITNFVAASLVCFAAVWGFFDHIAIESYGSRADDSAGSKMSLAAQELGHHFFLTRKQIGLDLRTFPRVLVGKRYDKWMSAHDWNEWVKDGGFDAHFTEAEVKTMLVPEDGSPHPPLVLSPDGKIVRGMLVHDLSLVFPFGFFVLGLRFLLRALLALSGHVKIDPDEAHKEDLHGASDAAKGGA
jgi:TRAP-type C4-dicarboxylate transport system permease small subunit